VAVFGPVKLFSESTEVARDIIAVIWLFTLVLKGIHPMERNKSVVKIIITHRKSNQAQGTMIQIGNKAVLTAGDACN
jgi:hypothetical protein